jgi:hypothetical protein
MLLAVAFIQGCGLQKAMRFPSPSGKYGIEIWQTRIDNSWGAELVLTTPKRSLVVSRSSREAVIDFVHVYWSPDETRVGIVVTGLIIWHLAVNTRTGAPIPFDAMRSDIAKSISDTYHLPSDKDSISWAGLSEAEFAFLKLHPEIRLTYH